MNQSPSRNITLRYVALCLLGAFALAAAGAADWPQHRGNPAGTANAPATSGRLLVPVWTQRLPSVGVNPASVTGNAAIVAGVVYIGSRNTTLYALDASSGHVLWQYATAKAIETSPLVKDGVVYARTFDGRTVALDVATRAVRFVHASGGMQERSSPNHAAGRIVAASSFPNKFIFAVDEASQGAASTAWTFGTGQFIYASPAVDPATQNIYCPSDDGRLYALRPDGLPLWNQPYEMIGGVFRASPAVANGKVYLSSGDYDWNLHAVNAATGALVWKAALTPTPALPSSYYRGIQVSSPAVDGDFVAIVGGYGNNLGPSILYAFRDNGAAAEPLWTVNLPNNTVQGYVSSPIITPHDVIVGVAAKPDAANPALPDGRMVVVDRATGQPTWYAAGGPAESGGPILASPAISGDLVVVGDTSGLVTAYRMVKAGDVDEDGAVTALDTVKMLVAAANDGVAAPAVRYRGDLLPEGTIPLDGARSFGDGLVTPADADLVLRMAIGLP